VSLPVDLCLAGAVLSAWIGCFGALRLGSALDRLHAVAFTNAAAGVLVAVAAFLADGISTRSVKLACLVAFVLVTGSAVSHAAGRALALRDGPQA
jgi:multicomponent Na+:H+ antiporter subunit G